MESKKPLKGFKFIKSNDDNIVRDIKEYFEEPKIYLKQINKIIIGKDLLKKYENKINGINEENKKLINNEKSVNNTNDNNTDKNNDKSKLNHKITKISPNKNLTENNRFYSLTEGNEKRPLSVGIHYEYKTPIEILNQYKECRIRENKEKLKGTNNLIPKNVIEAVRNQYINQEKRLKRNFFENEKDKLIIEHLSKKCKIKKEKLLYNSTDNYRIRNQFIDYIESNKNLYEKFGNYCWYMNLRRPKIMNESRGNYLNVGKIEKNIWEKVFDLPDKSFEVIMKTEKLCETKNDYEKFFKEKYIKQNRKINKKIRTNKLAELSDINNIKIKGKNMITFEKENFLKFENEDHKYRVFKDPREKNKTYSKDFTYKTNYKYTFLKYKGKKLNKYFKIK